MANTTLNPSDLLHVTLSNGNLTATGASPGFGGVRSIDRQLTGKFYWEYTVNSWTNNQTNVGIGLLATALNKEAAFGNQYGSIGVYKATGTIYSGGVSTGYALGARNSGDIIGVALDLDNQRIWFRVCPSGLWNGLASANPATQNGGIDITSQTLNGLSPVHALISFQVNLDVVTANFGDTAFSGAVPSTFTSGFTAGATPTNYEVITQAVFEQYGVPGTTPMALTQATLEQFALPGVTQMALTQIVLEQWATLNTMGQLTQIAVEQWADANPRAQMTQIMVEQWASLGGFGNQAILTQIAAEIWASVGAKTFGGITESGIF